MVIVNDKMQKGYCYELTEPEGKNFAPEFRPELSPAQILELGAFEGKYMTDCKNEFPAHWFENAKLSPEKPQPEINCFKIKSRLSLQEWQKKRMDYRTRSARLVSMVLQILSWEKTPRCRCFSDKEVESIFSPCGAN